LHYLITDTVKRTIISVGSTKLTQMQTRRMQKETPSEPAWVLHNASTDLKRDVLKRIKAFFSFQENRASHTKEYEVWKHDGYKYMNVGKLCNKAVDELQLRTIKRNTSGMQIIKKIMVLNPFNGEMEAPLKTNVFTPDVAIPMSDETSMKSSDDLTRLNEPFDEAMLKSDTQEIEESMKESHNEDIQVDKDRKDFDNLQQMEKIIRICVKEQMDTSRQAFEESVNEKLQSHKQEIQATLKNLIASNSVKNLVTASLHETTGKIEQDFKASMDAYVTELNEQARQLVHTSIMNEQEQAVKEIGNKITKAKEELHEKSENLIKEIQKKGIAQVRTITDTRSDVLVDINEEAAQAISELQYAAEQHGEELEAKREKYQAEHTTPVTPRRYIEPDEHPKKTHQRFSNVDVENLHAPHVESSRSARGSPGNTNYHSRNDRYQRNESLSSWTVGSFLKHFKAKLRNDNHILNFYQQLYAQGPLYGIHLKQLEDVHPNQNLWPDGFSSDDRNTMARAIYQKMQDDDCVSEAYSKAQQIIVQYCSSSDGYKVLEQLLRFVHPNLQQMSYSTYDVPKLSKCKGDLYEYGALVMDYVLRQKIRNRTYSEQEKAFMFLNNMDDRRYYEAKSRALTELNQVSSDRQGNIMDPNLSLDSLPTTISQYHVQFHGSSTEQDKGRAYYQKGFVRHITDNDEDDSNSYESSMMSVDEPQIRMFMKKRGDYNNRRQYNRYDRKEGGSQWKDSGMQCVACGKWGCSEKRCMFVAKVHVAMKYIKTNAGNAAKLAEEYLRINGKRTKMTTIRTLTSMSSHSGDNLYLSDQDLLNQYHVDIPMEEVDFDHHEE